MITRPQASIESRRIFFAIQAFKTPARVFQSDEHIEDLRGLFVIFRRPC